MVFWMLSSRASALTPKQIYQKTSPGVVFIYAVEGNKGSAGTGSIIREDGLVITNAHTFVRKNSSRLLSNIWIYLKPERVTGNMKKDLVRRFKGEILAYDIKLDLALLKMKGADERLTRVPFGDSEDIVVGDQAYAIGHPEQGGLWSLTTGVISAHKSDFGGVPGKDLFQTEASINRGNSGGPLLNEQAVMIGINSLIARKARDGLTITDVNFSIKSNVAIRWLKKVGYRFSSVEGVTSITEEKPVKMQVQEKKEPAKKESVIEEPAQKFKEFQSPKTKPTKERKEGKILTEKRPYNMDKLIADMQEMEDMMDEMRGKIKKYKTRRW
jgi:serine protease Do